MFDVFFGLIEKATKWIMFSVLKLSISEEKFVTMVQFLKFGIIGLSNTLISYIIYVMVLLGLQNLGVCEKIDYLVAQFLGFVISVLWSFYWNNKFVFKDENSQRNWFKALIKTYISYGFTGLFLNSILSILWVEILNWSKMIAPIVNLLISVPLNFVLNKFWAFKRT